MGWIGPQIRPRSGWTGPVRPVETRRARFGAKKKTRLLNGPGPDNRQGPAKRVRVSKIPTQTRHVVILSNEQVMSPEEPNILKEHNGRLAPNRPEDTMKKANILFENKFQRKELTIN